LSKNQEVGFSLWLLGDHLMVHTGAKLLISNALLLITILVPGSVQAQSARDVIKLMTQLQVKCDLGISYDDYFHELETVIYEADTFLESKEAKRNSQLTKDIELIVDYYIDAQVVWDYKYGVNSIRDFLRKDDEEGMALWLFIQREYPEALKDYRSGGVLMDSNNAILIDPLLSIIWGRASICLEEAREQLTAIRSESKTPEAPKTN
jgi:hypothetical protein